MQDAKYWSIPKKLQKIDYSDLVGKRILVLDFGLNEGPTASTNDPRPRIGVVAGGDPNIGVSVVYENDPKKIIICVHGPLDPNFRKSYIAKESLRKNYPISFTVVGDYIRECIENDMPFLYTEYNSRYEKAFREAGRIPLNGSGSLKNPCPYGV